MRCDGVAIEMWTTCTELRSSRQRVVARRADRPRLGQRLGLRCNPRNAVSATSTSGATVQVLVVITTTDRKKLKAPHNQEA
jgi:hypothetical protein